MKLLKNGHHTQETCTHFPALPSSIISAHKATLQW